MDSRIFFFFLVLCIPRKIHKTSHIRGLWQKRKFYHSIWSCSNSIFGHAISFYFFFLLLSFIVSSILRWQQQLNVYIKIGAPFRENGYFDFTFGKWRMPCKTINLAAVNLFSCMKILNKRKILTNCCCSIYFTLNHNGENEVLAKDCIGFYSFELSRNFNWHAKSQNVTAYS